MHPSRTTTFSVHTLLLWSSLLLCSVSAAPISDLQPLCRASEKILWGMLSFLGSNFLSHAATIPVTAGAKWFDTLMWTAIALFLPFAGLGRSIAMIAIYLQFKGNPIERAASRGAVVILARSQNWEPSEYEERVYVELPQDYENISYEKALETTAVVRPRPPHVHEGIICKCKKPSTEHAEVNLEGYNVHGDYKPPPGYAWAVVSIPFLDSIIRCFLQDLKDINLSIHQPLLKKVVSVGQLISASYTIYASKTDQISRYGYAAYALTVFPYAMMSFVNLVASGVLGDYPSIYVLRTPILQEAERRGGTFDGAVGLLRDPDEADPVLRDDMSEATLYVPGIDDKDGNVHEFKEDILDLWLPFLPPENDTTAKTPVWLSLVSHPTLPEHTALCVRTESHTKFFKYSSQPQTPGEQSITLHVGSVTNEPLSTKRREGTTRLLHTKVIALYVGSLIAVLVVPYIFLFLMSGFRTHCSSTAERAWTMAWLCASQASFLLFLYRFSSLPSAAWPALTIQSKMYSALCAILSVASIGGMYEVAKMYLQDEGFSTACSGGSLPVCSR